MRRHAAGDDEARAAGRRARAEAQVWAIIGDRLRKRLLSDSSGSGTREILDDVANHRLDPFEAADALVGPIDRPGMRAAADGPRPRLVTGPFLALAAATLAFFIAGGLVLPIAPRFAKLALGADALGFGIAIGAFSIASLLLRPVVGWSSDRFGRRPLLIGGSIVTVLGMLLHLFATDLLVFTIARGLLGAGEGFFFVAALAAAADIAPEERRGEAISFLSLSLYLGVAIGPPIAEASLRGGFLQRGLARRRRRRRSRRRAGRVRARVGAGADRSRERSLGPRPTHPPRGDLPGRRDPVRAVGDGGVPDVRAAVRPRGRDERRRPAACDLRPRRGGAADRRRDVARPVRRGSAVRRGADGVGDRASRSSAW